jgi:tryptophan halogenase
MAEGDGVTRVEGKIARVELDGESGASPRWPWTWQPDRGRPVSRLHRLSRAADRGRPACRFDDWTHYLPCDPAIAVQTASTTRPCPIRAPSRMMRLAMAHSAATPPGQRHRLLQPLSRP